MVLNNYLMMCLQCDFLRITGLYDPSNYSFERISCCILFIQTDYSCIGLHLSCYLHNLHLPIVLLVQEYILKMSFGRLFSHIQTANQLLYGMSAKMRIRVDSLCNSCSMCGGSGTFGPVKVRLCDKRSCREQFGLRPSRPLVFGIYRPCGDSPMWRLF